MNRQTIVTHLLPALAGFALAFVLPAWLVAGGAVWRAAARYELLRYVSFDQSRQDIEQLVRNYAVFQERENPTRPMIVWMGSSHAGFALDPELAETLWARAGGDARARVVWHPAIDMTGVYLLTQQLDRTDVTAVVLGLSPHMTLFDPDEPLAQADTVWRYADVWHPYPIDVDHRVYAVAWWCSPYRLRDGLWLVARATANRVLAPNRPYRASAMALDDMVAFADYAAFKEQRRLYTETRDPMYYVLSFGGFPSGATFVGWRREVFATNLWEPTTPPWDSFRQWRRLMRERGVRPIVVLLPLNPIYQDPAMAAVIPGGDPTRPIIDADRLAQWTADVRREVADTPGLLLWDDLNTMSPDAFYDVEHMLPEARTWYTRRIAQRLLDAGVVGPRPPVP